MHLRFIAKSDDHPNHVHHQGSLLFFIYIYLRELFSFFFLLSFTVRAPTFFPFIYFCRFFFYLHIFGFIIYEWWASISLYTQKVISRIIHIHIYAFIYQTIRIKWFIDILKMFSINTFIISCFQIINTN